MPFRGEKIAVVVPAHNEERLIGRVLAGMPKFVDAIIVVDDGSSDRTSAKARASGDSRTILLRHGSRRGVGEAIRTGYRLSLEQGADITAVMAGDAQMDPGGLAALLDPLVDGRADYAKGNRLAHPSLYHSMPAVRVFGNHILSKFTRLALGQAAITDSQCGYTAITSSALKEILPLHFCRGYGYPNEILCNLVIRNKRIADVPVKAVYGDETSGIRIPTYSVKMALILSRCVVRRFGHSFARAASRITSWFRLHRKYVRIPE